MTNRILAATLLVALSTTTTFAATTPFGGPSAPSGPAISTGGEIDSPGDPFRPQVRTPRVGTETYSMSCAIGEGKFANGASIIKLVNTSSKTIPKGATIEIIYPDGSKHTVTAPADVAPGGSLGLMAPSWATPDNFPCSASASRQVAVGEPGPAVDNGSSANQSIPPKLVCEFEIIDGKVILHWTNEGGSPVPVGAMITGKNAAGIGVSSFIQDPIEPGETVTIELDMDPKFFDEPCKTTVTYP